MRSNAAERSHQATGRGCKRISEVARIISIHAQGEPMTTHSEQTAAEPAEGRASTPGSAAGQPGSEAAWHGAPADPRRWKTLAVLGFIQFMLVLDVTVVNIALPSIQKDLHFSDSGLPWIINAYVIVAGGLLLFGGRLADIFGRRRLFLIGVAIFAAASAVCGAANNSAVLVIGRFVQGAGEACAAPAALGIIALLFIDPAERGKALGLWGGLAGLGGVSRSAAIRRPPAAWPASAECRAR